MGDKVQSSNRPDCVTRESTDRGRETKTETEREREKETKILASLWYVVASQKSSPCSLPPPPSPYLPPPPFFVHPDTSHCHINGSVGGWRGIESRRLSHCGLLGIFLAHKSCANHLSRYEKHLMNTPREDGALKCDRREKEGERE